MLSPASVAVVRGALCTSALLLFRTVHAADAPLFAAPATGTTTGAAGSGSIGQVTIALGVVLAFVFLAAWALRRLRKLNLSGNPQQMEVVAQIALGAKERAILIRVRDMQVLVGVAPGRVTALHAFPVSDASTLIAPQTDAPATGVSTPAPLSFQALLKKSLGLS